MRSTSPSSSRTSRLMTGSGSPARTTSIRNRVSIGESTFARTYAAACAAARADGWDTSAHHLHQRRRAHQPAPRHRVAEDHEVDHG